MKKVYVAFLLSVIGLGAHAQSTIYDVNNDGRVSIKDLTMATNYLNGHINYPVTKVTLNYTAVDINIGKGFTLKPTLTPTDADMLTYTIECTDTSICSIKSSNVVRGKALGRAQIICKAKDNCGAQASVDVMVYDKDVDDYEYVDLGLPSGTLWATCNLGANSPEEAGSYFSWGETIPMGQPDSTNLTNIAYTGGSNVKTTCRPETYKYCDGDTAHITKYCTVRSKWYGEGEMDSTFNLSKMDDAARNMRGANWVMPVTSNYNELRADSNCVWTWCDGDSIKYNGTTVKGYLVTSRHNGNTLFFPASGYYNGTTCLYSNTYGYFWTRPVRSADPTRAWYFRIMPTSYTSTISPRFIGMPIRPIRVQKASALTTTN